MALSPELGRPLPPRSARRTGHNPSNGIVNCRLRGHLRCVERTVDEWPGIRKLSRKIFWLK